MRENICKISKMEAVWKYFLGEYWVHYILRKIKGIPYGMNKTRGDMLAPQLWTQAIINQTADLPRVSEACILRVTFFLPADKFPSDFPYGPDLDNLLKRFLDALNTTIFCNSKGNDSCVISMHAAKTKTDELNDSGAFLEILPVSV